MSVAATNLATTGSNVDATSHTTASISPTANRLLLLWVYSIAGAAPNIPTVSGNGLTWDQIDSQLDSSGLRRITLFRAMGASPSAGAVTISFGGQTQTGAAWSIVEYSDVDTSGSNGSGAIVQAVKAATVGNATSQTITLAAFSSTDNATAGGFGIPLNTAATPVVGSGFTATGQRNQSTPNLSIASEFKATNDTGVDMTSGAASIPWVGIAVEIKEALSPALSTLVDDFTTDQLASKWNGTYGTTSVTGGQAVIPIRSGYLDGMVATGSYDLRNSAIYWEMVTVPDTSGTREIYCELSTDGNNKFGLNVIGGNLVCKWIQAGTTSDTTTPFNAVTHRWLRLREASGTLYWDVSADGTTWTNIRSVAHSMTIKDIFMGFATGYYGTETAASLILDNVNTPPALTDTGQIKVFTGTDFEAKPIKAYDGSAFVVKPLKFYNGTSWEETPY